MVRTYLDCVVELPWGRSTKDFLDIKKAKAVLDENHYGLDKAKERILEYLSVQKAQPKEKGADHLFCRPSGCGQDLSGPVPLPNP